MVHRYSEYLAFEQSKKQRDLLAELENTKNKLRIELTKLGFCVTEPLLINGSRNRNIQQKGKYNEWSYIAWYQKNETGNTSLQCSVGFTDKGKHEDISIPIQEIKKKR